MSGSHQVELIRFENPQGSEARLYIPKIAWNGNKLDLSNLLRDKLSRFGLLHSLYIDCSTDLGTTTGGE